MLPREHGQLVQQGPRPPRTARAHRQHDQHRRHERPGQRTPWAHQSGYSQRHEQTRRTRRPPAIPTSPRSAFPDPDCATRGLTRPRAASRNRERSVSDGPRRRGSSTSGLAPLPSAPKQRRMPSPTGGGCYVAGRRALPRAGRALVRQNLADRDFRRATSARALPPPATPIAIAAQSQASRRRAARGDSKSPSLRVPPRPRAKGTMSLPRTPRRRPRRPADASRLRGRARSRPPTPSRGAAAPRDARRPRARRSG